MEDPTPPLDTPEVFGGLKTWLFEGPKYIELKKPLGTQKEHHTDAPAERGKDACCLLPD